MPPQPPEFLREILDEEVGGRKDGPLLDGWLGEWAGDGEHANLYLGRIRLETNGIPPHAVLVMAGRVAVVLAHLRLSLCLTRLQAQ